MPEVTLSATVSPEGKLLPLAPSVWIASMREFAGKRVDVTVATERTGRSLQANKYWWSCVIPVFQEIWGKGRSAVNLPPYSRDQVHAVLVEALAGSEDGPLPGSRVRLETKGMDTATFAKLVDAGRKLAWDEYQVRIPEPGERYEA